MTPNKELKAGFFTRILIKFWPAMAVKQMARQMGINNPLFDKAHYLFTKVKRVDLVPLKSGLRGFMVVLDRRTALYFYQNNDHFVYDGYEMGMYNKGDVTIFDQTKG
ncbi:hypothetical protein C4553_01470 [Candidatus Parcubacteria bacterium]|nr:MAG: hypothetical protein C4553_01470 [Candidatus Parcubacteria bacterium]